MLGSTRTQAGANSARSHAAAEQCFDRQRGPAQRERLAVGGVAGVDQQRDADGDQLEPANGSTSGAPATQKTDGDRQRDARTATA